MARIALTIGAAVAGAFISVVTGGLGAFAVGAWATDIIAGLAVGAAIGNAAGGLIFPVKLPNQFGPRIADLSVSTAVNGAPIPFGYGIYRFAGNIIWSPGLKEHSKTTKHSAKGGPSYSSTDYTYTASFAMAFGESYGTPSTRFGDILKVWFDTKVIYQTSQLDLVPSLPLHDISSASGGFGRTFMLEIPAAAHSGITSLKFSCESGTTGMTIGKAFVKRTDGGSPTFKSSVAATFNGGSTSCIVPGSTIQTSDRVVVNAANGEDVYILVYLEAGWEIRYVNIGISNPVDGIAYWSASDLDHTADADNRWSGGVGSPSNWFLFTGPLTISNTSKYPSPTIYHGTETQNPDPLIQGVEGASKTPAFRGLIYAVWEDFPLADFGNRIPNIQALVNFGQ